MSILENFLILFSSNADEVESDFKKVEDASDKVGKSLDDVTDASDKVGQNLSDTGKEAKKLGDNLSETVKTVVTAGTAMLALGKIVSGVFSATAFAENMERQSRILGVSTEVLNGWSEAVVRAGGSTEGLLGSINSLNSSMTQLSVTGSSDSLQYLSRLGISGFKDDGSVKMATDLLLELADSFQGLTAQQAQGFGAQLGLDEGTILLLQKGRREVEEMILKQKELGVVGQEDAEISRKFSIAMQDLGQSFRVVFSKIAGDALPAMTWLIEKLTEFGQWIQKHHSYIYGFFIGLSGVLVGVAVSSGAAAAALSLLLSPIVAVIAAGVAVGAVFGLLFEDFTAFFSGAPSLVGSFVEAVKGLFMSLYEYIKPIVDFITKGINFIFRTEIGELPETDDLFGNKKITSDDNLIPPPGIAELLGTKNLSQPSTIAELLGKGSSQISEADEFDISSLTGTAISNSSRNSSSNAFNIGEIVVNTAATDATGISIAITDSLQEQMLSAAAGFDNGIKG